MPRLQETEMPEPAVDRWSSDQGILCNRILELREICRESVNQRDRAKRQRRSAMWMREEAREIRERTWRDWPSPQWSDPAGSNQ